MSAAQDMLFAEDAARRSSGFAPAPCSAFRCVVADPPWEYPEGFATQSRSPGKWEGEIKCKPLPYPSMTVEEIRALPVRDMAADDCRLWLWTTNRYLPAAFGVMEAWGFEYRQTLVWHKADGNMGGSVAPNSAEFLLVGVRGSPPCKKRMPASVVRSTKKDEKIGRKSLTASRYTVIVPL